MSGYKDLEILLAETAEQYKNVKNALRRAPKGSLLIQKNREYLSFLRVTQTENGRIRKGIGKDSELVYRLANKAYLSELEKRMSFNISLLQEAYDRSLDISDADVLRALPKNYDFLDLRHVLAPTDLANKAYQHPVSDKSILPRRVLLNIGDMDPAAWACMPYAENTKYSEFKTHITSKGFACRSKSEAALIELYDSLGILIHYDEVIEINGKYVSPDFIGVRRDGRLIFHEHVGLQEQGYRNGLYKKMGIYASAGIFQGNNLILTFDDEYGRLNLQLASAIIRERYMIDIV